MKLTRNILKELIIETTEKILSEGKRRQLEVHRMDKKKVEKILKLLKLKPGKHFDVGVGKQGSILLDVDVKYLDKLVSLLMKNRVRVR